MDTPARAAKSRHRPDALGDYNLLVGDRLMAGTSSAILANHFLTRWLGLNIPSAGARWWCSRRLTGKTAITSPRTSTGGRPAPGETIEVRQNQVYIDGQKLVEPYRYHAIGEDVPTTGRWPADPDGHYFMMGDNRDHSSDGATGAPSPRSSCSASRCSSCGRFPTPSSWRRRSPTAATAACTRVNDALDVVKLYAYRVIYFYQDPLEPDVPLRAPRHLRCNPPHPLRRSERETWSWAPRHVIGPPDAAPLALDRLDRRGPHRGRGGGIRRPAGPARWCWTPAAAKAASAPCSAATGGGLRPRRRRPAVVLRPGGRAGRPG